MTAESSHHLAATARFTAAARAQESARSDALFRDPLAGAFAGEVGQRLLAQLPPAATTWPVIRTRFLDDLIATTLTHHPFAQVVLVAAGFDARAYRLPWTSATRIFELDQPAVLADKARVLAALGATPACPCIVCAVDLRHDWGAALLDAGFRPDEPALWIVEGLLLYLDEADARLLLATLSGLAAPGSVLGLDLPARSLKGHTVADPGRWLGQWGWRAMTEQIGDAARRYGRWPKRDAPAATASAQSPIFLIAAHKE